MRYDATEMQIKEKLKDICARLNIEYAGIAPPGPYGELAEILECAVKGDGRPRFSEEEIIAKTDPRAAMADVKSIIVCLFPYYTSPGGSIASLDTHVADPGSAVTDSDATVTNSDAAITNSGAAVTNSDAAITNSDAAITNSNPAVTNSDATVTNSDAAITNSNPAVTNSDAAITNSNPAITNSGADAADPGTDNTVFGAGITDTTVSKTTANISMHAWGRDYHKVVREILDKIGRQLSNHIDNFKYMLFTDTGPLADRYLAYLAGLGFYGRNSFIINEKYGSYVFIGYMLTNYPFEPDKPLNATCLECGQCIENCPGSAIPENDRGLVVEKCISYITQKKGSLTDDEKSLLRRTGMVYGCDICQLSCPHNRKAAETPIPEFSQDQVRSLAMDDLGLTNKEFKGKYGNRAFAWRGRKVLERNIRICEGLEG
jgi:epoxyqueuosine reductase